jgi:hypothetical protein
VSSTADLLESCLRAARVRRVWGAGAAAARLRAIDAGDAALARLLADADGRIGPGPGAALVDDGELWLSSRPGGAPTSDVVVDRAGDVSRAVREAAELAGGPVPATARVRLALDLDAPAPSDARPDVPPPRPMAAPPVDVAVARDAPIVVLAGPGVARQERTAGLHAFAAAHHVGVANTWGLKGVFRWDSPHHLGTVGLQADDFRLLGLSDAALVIATGLDPDEAPPAAWHGFAPSIELPPDALDALAGRAVAARAPRDIARPELFQRLAAVVNERSASAQVPLSPARAVADLRAVLPDGGLLAADPGVAGLWVARTFPTTELGSVVVPATRADGIAAALALTASLDGRPAIAVTDAPLTSRTRDVLALAARLGAAFPVVVWGADGDLDRADDHAHHVAHALLARSITVLDVPIDPNDTQLLLNTAGPVIAWGGLPLRSVS